MRSTPMPKVTRRTVNDAPASSPRRCITTPSNGCTVRFFQDHVDSDGVARAEIGEVFAQLRLLRFYKYRIHSLISRQTRSGGASTLRTIINYTQIWAVFPQKLHDSLPIATIALSPSGFRTTSLGNTRVSL